MSRPLGPAAAAELALDALLWLADRPEAMARFLAETGADPASLREFAREPAGLGSVLDFLLGSEALVLAYAAERGVDPALPARARAALPGGDLPNWT